MWEQRNSFKTDAESSKAEERSWAEITPYIPDLAFSPTSLKLPLAEWISAIPRSNLAPGWPQAHVLSSETLTDYSE